MIDHPYAVAAIGSGILGLIVGSFAGVVADRVPRGESIVKPPSHCTSCEAELRPIDNVPVLSYLVLRGKCRNCGVKIPPGDLYIELATAGSFALIAGRLPTFWALPAFVVIAAGLVALSSVDFRLKRLPSPILYTTAAIALPLFVLASWRSNRWGHLIQMSIGAAACFAIFAAIWFVAPKSMGFGDVRLSALCGGALGWVSGKAVFVGMFIGFVLAVIPSLYLLSTGKANRKTAVPFGPFLAAGTVLGIAFGPAIAHFWLNL